MTTYNGKCHCGQTAWAAELPENEHILCHCDTCKQLGGGAYSLNQIIPKKNLKITKGALKTYTYKGDSGKSVNCYYCPNCTTHAYHHQEAMGPDTIVIRTILLDGAKKWKAHAEIFGKDRMDWEKEVATTFEVMPPS
ncbi:hypothetical protein FH972_022723 [Carpinus fangiana]|uniref:CENP-V/GFA domain-containing protein n=1 Tax=Carpinus fangiana TaxID=176857 RepID=A0A5N6KTE0_9ROSI|nr:hypothetical protein FH972_022723 [Carpinus fangiana]